MILPLGAKIVVSLLGAGALQAAANDTPPPAAPAASDTPDAARRRLFAPGALRYAASLSEPEPIPGATAEDAPAAPEIAGGIGDAVSYLRKLPLDVRSKRRVDEARWLRDHQPALAVPVTPPVSIVGQRPVRKAPLPTPDQRPGPRYQEAWGVSEDPPSVLVDPPVVDPPVVDPPDIDDAVAWLLETFGWEPIDLYLRFGDPDWTLFYQTRFWPPFWARFRDPTGNDPEQAGTLFDLLWNLAVQDYQEANPPYTPE